MRNVMFVLALHSKFYVHCVPQFHNKADEICSSIPFGLVFIGGREMECITGEIGEDRSSQFDTFSR